MKFYVYILICKDDFLYTGITWSINKRIKEHLSGSVPSTKNRLPVKLVYKEEFATIKDTAKREKEIKGWRREKKNRLIKSSP